MKYSEARELFDYNPETGVLNFRYRPEARKQWNTRYAGKEAGYVSPDGYRKVGVFKKRLYAHRIIWLWMTGVSPNTIDHDNRDRSDNRWCNLRNGTIQTNSMNTKLPSDNKTGVIGVRRHANGKGFIAFIAIDGKQRHLAYGSLIDCVAARMRAERLYGYHDNHGL